MYSLASLNACRRGSLASEQCLPCLADVEHYDSIIIGAGHNGLVCAAYLAAAGQTVLVLEAADAAGGLAATREFHDGYVASVAHSAGHFSARVAKDLDLAAHGLKYSNEPLALIGLDVNGNHVRIENGSVAGAGDDDAAAYPAYEAFMRKLAAALEPFWFKTMPRIGNNSFGEILTFAQLGLKLRGLGKSDMHEFMRVISLPTRDLMDENFDNELLKATLSWDGLIGARLAPRSPNAAVIAMLYRLSGTSAGAHVIPDGGMPALIDALAGAAKAAGAEIRCASKIDRILIDGNIDGLAIRGVQLADGEKVEATRIVSSTDPKRTFEQLVGVEYLDIEFTNRIRRLRSQGYVAKLHLALGDEPEFAGLDRADGRLIVAPDMEAIERAFDHAKYGELPDEPVMEVVIPSLNQTGLAPDGHHVLSAHVMYVPYALRGGWDDTARQTIADRSIATLERYAPGIREHIVHAEFLTPADLEREYRASGGHWHHGELAMDQMLMMRPTYEAAQYATPIPGLYLCGAGSHPAGDIVGAAGRNAAREILR